MLARRLTDPPQPPEDPTLTPLIHSLIPTPILDGHTSYYHNISGFLSGPSQIHNLTTLPEISTDFNASESSKTFWHPLAEKFITDADMNATEVAERIGIYNWTGIDKATLSLLELQHDGDENHAFDSPEELILMHVSRWHVV